MKTTNPGPLGKMAVKPGREKVCFSDHFQLGWVSWRFPKELLTIANARFFTGQKAFPVTQATVLRHSLSILTAIFSGEPGLAGFIEAKDDGSGGDNWSYKLCKAPVKSPPPTDQHPTFLQAGCPFCRPTVSKHWREKCQGTVIRKTCC